MFAVSVARNIFKSFFFSFAGFGGADISGRKQLSGSQRGGAGQRAERVRAPHSHEGGELY